MPQVSRSKHALAALAAAIMCAAFWTMGLPAMAVSSGTLPGQSAEDRMVTDNPPGRRGGEIAVALRSDPKTLNPALAEDATSRDIIYCMNADLIHINRKTQETESALAKSWSVSHDGKTYTLQLRRGLRFSDGKPFNAVRQEEVIHIGVHYCAGSSRALRNA